MSALKTSLFCFALMFLTGDFAVAANPRIGMSTAASRYFGGGNTIMPHQPARRPAPAPQPMDITGRGKPFHGLYRQPTLSPYLTLDLVNDDGTGLPNYYAFVQPLLMQQSTNQSQQKQFGRMEQQLRAVSTNGIIANNPSGGMPTTGHSTQFLNMGNYFPGR